MPSWADRRKLNGEKKQIAFKRWDADPTLVGIGYPYYHCNTSNKDMNYD